MKPYVPDALSVLPYLLQMDAARIYSNFGPLVKLLERRYAEFLNVKPEQVISVSSGTLGITGAVSVSRSTSWMVPVWTFPATALAVLESGGELAFGDIEPATWSLDTNQLDLQSHRGLLPVVPFGGQIELAVWQQYDEVVIDGAASLGNAPDLSKLPIGWSVVFSLHATKVLGSGEGGLVVFGDIERAQMFRAWTNFGFLGTRCSEFRGTNAKMSEAAAAYALAALDGWPMESQQWVEVRQTAYKLTSRLGLSTGETSLNDVNPYWIIDCKSEIARKLLEASLNDRGIETRKWWPSALSEMRAFSHMGYDTPVDFPVAHSISRQVLGLPMFRDLTRVDFREIEDCLAQFAESWTKLR